MRIATTNTSTNMATAFDMNQSNLNGNQIGKVNIFNSVLIRLMALY